MHPSTVFLQNLIYPTMRSSFRPFAFFFLGVLMVLPTQAQTTYTFLPDSELWIEGTSNKSDWTVHATEMEGAVAMSGADAIESATLTVPSQQIVSNKSTIMDRLMHKTLMVDQHANITYELTHANVEPGDGGTFQAFTRGNLTIAETTNEIEVVVTGEAMDDGRYRFTGSHPLKMTDYGLTTPVAMFGALRTADDTVVHFNFVVASE